MYAFYHLFKYRIKKLIATTTKINILRRDEYLCIENELLQRNK
jgi:hypothetical protein